MGEIIAVKIIGTDNPSDAETKALTFKVWKRLVWYSNNRPGDMPEL